MCSQLEYTPLLLLNFVQDENYLNKFEKSTFTSENVQVHRIANTDISLSMMFMGEKLCLL